MSRSFDFSLESTVSVAEIHAAFAARDYWLARLAMFGGLGALDSLTVRPDGTVTAVVVKEIQHDGLSGPAAKLFPRRWRVVQTENWSPVDNGRIRGKVSIVPHGAPGAGSCTALIAPVRTGSRLECTATMTFDVPIIGGTVETVMGRLLVQNISAMQHFTTEWITEHA